MLPPEDCVPLWKSGALYFNGRAWRRRRQISRDDDALKCALFVRAVTKRFVRGMPATAKRHACPPAKSENTSLRIHNFEVAFHSDGSIVADRDFSRRHFQPFREPSASHSPFCG